MRPILTFISVAYLFSYGLAITIGLTGGRKSPLATPLGLVSMLTPAIAALIVRRAFAVREPEVGFRRFNVRHALLAVLVPVALTTAASLVYLAAVGELHVAAWLTPDAAGRLQPSPDSRFGTEPFEESALRMKIGVNLAVNLLLLTVLAMGEEFGWRGFLQPQLGRRCGARRGAVLTATIWAFWHTGFHIAGVHFPEHVIVVGTLFGGPALLIGFGVFLGWLYVRTRSLWVVALGHASANAWSQFPLRFLDVPRHTEGPLLIVIGSSFLLLAASSLLWLPWEPVRASASTPEANS